MARLHSPPSPECRGRKSGKTEGRRGSMNDTAQTHAQLLHELTALRQQMVGLEAVIVQHTQVETALRESEAKYRALFEEAHDAMYITTREGTLLDVNQAALDLFGYTRIDVRKLYVNPDDRRRFQQAIEHTGAVRDYEMKCRKQDGTEVDCLNTATVRWAADGSMLGYQGIIHDITARQHAERALVEQRRQLEQQVESVPRPCKPKTRN
jgi:PAS domain S-box-containing protein